MHTDYLQHHGILGQKWGIRRYQNPDGSLTSAGKKRYSGNESEGKQKKERKKLTPQQKQKIKEGVIYAASAAIMSAYVYDVYRQSKSQIDYGEAIVKRAQDTVKQLKLEKDSEEWLRTLVAQASKPRSSSNSSQNIISREGGMRLDELYSSKQLRGLDNSYFDGTQIPTVNLDGIPRRHRS